MEMPRAYVRKIDPPLFQRVVEGIEKTGSYRDRNTVYAPAGVIGENQSGRFSDLFGGNIPESVRGAELLLNSGLGFNGEGRIHAQRTRHRIWVLRHEPNQVTLWAYRADPPHRDRFLSSMDLSACDLSQALSILRTPVAIGTIGEEREKVAGFLGGDSQYLGTEENPFS